MKTNLFLMLATMMLSVSGCRVSIGDSPELVEPSAKIVKAKYPQEAFNKVDNHVVGNIQLVQSDQSRVTLSAPENYIDFFEFKNEDGELNINYAKDNVNIHTANVTIIIYTPTLNEVQNSGAADIRLDSLKTDAFKVKNSGVGSFQLNRIHAQSIDVTCSGVGSINIDGKTDEAEYSCSGERQSEWSRGYQMSCFRVYQGQCLWCRRIGICWPSCPKRPASLVDRWYHRTVNSQVRRNATATTSFL